MARNTSDLTGQRFGRLTVVGRAGATKQGVIYACACDCGSTANVRRDALKRGQESCGCLAREMSGERARERCTTHGGTGTPEYETWRNVIARCRNPRAAKYHLYGGRGIGICDRWAGSFEAFLADMGPRPSPRHSIDRIDSDGDYEPANCRWATVSEQNNNKRINVVIEFQGRRQTMAQWAREYGICPGVLRGRLERGWETERALTAPVGGK